ncbi:MAG: hypothetical protein BWX59_01989 [Bacteroidetes bacterium ADurb.Bin028]|jgi:hypothetical protein|nr:MAG: hypothetical protein BWX59_01989 [Bacteroidetes bacterium ADurb.Bin028]
MKILISEKQLKWVLKTQDVLEEQSDTLNDQRLLIVLQNRINDILDKKEKEILNRTSIKIVNNKGQLSLQIGERIYPMRRMVQGVYALIIPERSKLTFGVTSSADLIPEIEKINEYKILSEKYPNLRAQIENNLVNGVIFTDQNNQGTFKLTITRKLPDVKEYKSAVDFGSEYPLGEFFERNKLIYKFGNDMFGILESGQLNMNLAGIPLKLEQTTNKPQVAVAPISISTMALGDVFNFDSIEFKDENLARRQYGAFIQQIRHLIQKYGEPFINHMKSQNPTIYGYSSVDADPEQPITGGYKPCAGNKTRRDYDLCLSQERARVIADILNKELPELGGIFKFKGMGETTKFGPGWTKENPTVPEVTAPNRRYVLSDIQPFTIK